MLRATPAALAAGAGLEMVLNSALPDSARWTGDRRMIPAIGAATMAAKGRFRAVALRCIPVAGGGIEIAVRPGDRLQPSRKYDEDGNLTEGLDRGAHAFGFRDRASLESAIGALAYQLGRQICLIAGSGALRSAQYGTYVILAPTVIITWYRQYSGLGRFSPYVEHADFD